MTGQRRWDLLTAAWGPRRRRGRAVPPRRGAQGRGGPAGWPAVQARAPVPAVANPPPRRVTTPVALPPPPPHPASPPPPLPPLTPCSHQSPQPPPGQPSARRPSTPTTRREGPRGAAVARPQPGRPWRRAAEPHRPSSGYGGGSRTAVVWPRWCRWWRRRRWRPRYSHLVACANVQARSHASRSHSLPHPPNAALRVCGGADALGVGQRQRRKAATATRSVCKFVGAFTASSAGMGGATCGAADGGLLDAMAVHCSTSP